MAETFLMSVFFASAVVFFFAITPSQRHLNKKLKNNSSFIQDANQRLFYLEGLVRFQSVQINDLRAEIKDYGDYICDMTHIKKREEVILEQNKDRFNNIYNSDSSVQDN
jgi:hypothetical protein